MDGAQKHSQPDDALDSVEKQAVLQAYETQQVGDAM
jgi:hypothetical protein